MTTAVVARRRRRMRGFVVLDESLTMAQLLGIDLVIVASVSASLLSTRFARRRVLVGGC